MQSSLRSCVGLLGSDVDILSFPWWNLRYAHTSALRAALAEKYDPVGGNKTMSAIKGVLKACWRL
jgi:hypothetical protein